MRTRRALVFAIVVASLALLAVAAAPALKRHNDSVRCGNQMHAILFVAALEWPDEQGGKLLDSFVSISNELIMPALLVCHGEQSRRPATTWSSLAPGNCSYELVTPGLSKGDSNSVFLRCPVHGYAGYADVRLLDSSGRLVKPDRLW